MATASSHFSMRVATFVGFSLCSSPFLVAAYVLAFHLEPIRLPDAFAYLWEGPLSLAYFTGRSLTQRVAFSLTGNELRAAAALQLLSALGGVLVAFGVLRERRGAYDLLLALGLTALFSSPHFNLAALVVTPEPLHVLLLILFTLSLFGRRRPAGWLVFVAGCLLVFSKTTAPYFVLIALALAVAFAPTPRNRSTLYALGSLAAVAVLSMGLTLRYDTSVELNVLNNLFKRVFPDRPTMLQFQRSYDMPIGPFVEACAGRDVNTPCLGGDRNYFVDPSTSNYRLIPGHPLTDWVRQKGRGAWVDYIVFQSPSRTLREIATGWGEALRTETVNGPLSYLDISVRDGAFSNRQLLRIAGLHHGDGLFGFDPIRLIARGLVMLGYSTPAGLVGWLAVAAALALLEQKRERPVTPIRLGAASMFLATALFAVAYLGDAFEVERHVYPALVLFSVGVAAVLMGVVNLISTVGPRDVPSTAGSSNDLGPLTNLSWRETAPCCFAVGICGVILAIGYARADAPRATPWLSTRIEHPKPSSASDTSETLNRTFHHGGLAFDTGEGNLVATIVDDQPGLQSRNDLDSLNEVRFDLRPSRALRLRCYPRFEGMEWFAPSLYYDGALLEPNAWHRVSLLVTKLRGSESRRLLTVRIVPLPSQGLGRVGFDVGRLVVR